MGVGAKLTFLEGGVLANISLYEAHYSSPHPPLPDNYCTYRCHVNATLAGLLLNFGYSVTY